MASGSGAATPSIAVSKEGLRQIRRWGLWINLGSFLTGYATAVIAGALLYIRGDLNLNDAQQGLVTSIVLLGAMGAAVVTGHLAERFGRKPVLGIAGVLFAAGLVISAVATGFAVLIAA